MDYNVPAIKQYYAYEFKLPLMEVPLYLCAEHSEEFTLEVDNVVAHCRPGFNVWQIRSSDSILIKSDKKIFNLYLSYSGATPRQFY